MSVTDDASRIAVLIRQGLLPGETRWVSHNLYFPHDPAGALSAYKEVGPDPFAMLDEEVEGGGHWHVVVVRKHEIAVESLGAIRDELGAVAARHGGIYGGWILTYGGNGRMLPPDGDPIFGTFENLYPFP